MYARKPFMFWKKGVNMAEKYVVCCSNKKRSYFVV